jgi:hypothetical protein
MKYFKWERSCVQRGSCFIVALGLALALLSVIFQRGNRESVSQALIAGRDASSFLVIVLGHSRNRSLQRLLNSLAKVNWMGNRIDLRIWIDGTDSAESFQVAKNFQWCHGEKILRTRESHYGLQQSWLHAWQEWDRHEYALFLEDDLEIHPQLYQIFRYLRAKIDSPEVGGIILERLADVPCGSYVHFASSWAPLFSRRLFHDFIRWYRARLACVPDFQPFVPGHEQTYNLWLRQRRDVWSPWFRRYLFEKGVVFLYAGSLGIIHNHQERGSHQRDSHAFFVNKMDWSPVKGDRIQNCILREPATFECNHSKGGLACQRVDGDRNALTHRGINEILKDKLWICGALAEH